MDVYEVKFVNQSHGVTVKQRISAPNGNEALRLVVKQQNDFLGVDYDPEDDPYTLVIVTKIKEPTVKTYTVNFYYTMEVVAEDSDEAEEIAWELFCEETEASNFACEATLKEQK